MTVFTFIRHCDYKKPRSYIIRSQVSCETSCCSLNLKHAWTNEHWHQAWQDESCSVMFFLFIFYSRNWIYDLNKSWRKNLWMSLVEKLYTRETKRLNLWFLIVMFVVSLSLKVFQWVSSLTSTFYHQIYIRNTMHKLI